MSLRNLHQRRQRIDRLMHLAKSPELLGREEHQYLCRYVCIRLIVYLDQALGDILSEHCKTRLASTQISQLVSSFIDRNAKNLNCSKILKILEGIDKEWAKQFAANVTEEGTSFNNSKIPSQLGSLKGVRDRLAHDDESTVNLSTLEESYKSINEVISILKNIILSDTPTYGG